MQSGTCTAEHQSDKLRRFEHNIKGQGIYAFVTLHDGNEYSEEIRKDLVKTVREQIGAFAAPDVIHWAPGQLHATAMECHLHTLPDPYSILV